MIATLSLYLQGAFYLSCEVKLSGNFQALTLQENWTKREQELKQAALELKCINLPLIQKMDNEFEIRAVIKSKGK